MSIDCRTRLHKDFRPELSRHEVVTMVGNLIVGGHDTLRGLAFCGLQGHPNHHGQATDIGQWFVGQAAGRQPGRDQDRETRVLVHGAGVGGLGRAASSSLIVRASCSSRMGMPSRTG